MVVALPPKESSAIAKMAVGAPALAFSIAKRAVGEMSFFMVVLSSLV